MQAPRGANMPKVAVPKKKTAAQLKGELGMSSVPDAEVQKVQTLFEYYDSDGEQESSGRSGSSVPRKLLAYLTLTVVSPFQSSCWPTCPRLFTYLLPLLE